MDSATYTVVLQASGAILVLYFAWQRLFPQPLPGIPYIRESANQLFGDYPRMIKEARATGDVTFNIFHPNRELKQPVAQFLLPFFRRSLVVVDDPREAEDILSRRSKEFDRSPSTVRLFRPMIPKSTLAQYTTPELKVQKRLWGDVMGTDFLRRTVAPNIRAATLDLVELWHVKAVQANGEPFNVLKDFEHAALDAIVLAILGMDLKIVKREVDELRRAEAGSEAKALGEEEEQLRKQKAMTSDLIQLAMFYLNKLVSESNKSMFPALSIWYMQRTRGYKDMISRVNGELHRLMTAACARFEKIQGNDDGAELDRSAMDLVLRRSILAARKAGLPPPDPTKDDAMLQELLVLLMAVCQAFKANPHGPSWASEMLQRWT
jgi:hypothetical protein